MTLEERVARLEERSIGQAAWLESIDKKVDQLLAVANAGKGAIAIFLKVGTVLAAVVAAVVWLITLLVDHFHIK